MGTPFYHRLISGRQVSPQMISAIILKRIKADAERRVGPIRRAVITVPAYFDHTRREATAEAGRLAGLEVVDILNERPPRPWPTAFRRAFSTRLAGRSTAAKPCAQGVLTVLVYDLGGGPIDVTVMQIRDRQFQNARHRRRRPPGRTRLGPADRRPRRRAIPGRTPWTTILARAPKRSNPFCKRPRASNGLFERTLPRTKLIFSHNAHRLSLELISPASSRR